MNLKELNRNLRHCVEHPEDWFLFLKKMKIKIKWMDGCSRIFWSSITASYFQTLFKCKIKISEKKTTAAFCLLSSHKTTSTFVRWPYWGVRPMCWEPLCMQTGSSCSSCSCSCDASSGSKTKFEVLEENSLSCLQKLYFFTDLELLTEGSRRHYI